MTRRPLVWLAVVFLLGTLFGLKHQIPVVLAAGILWALLAASAFSGAWTGRLWALILIPLVFAAGHFRADTMQRQREELLARLVEEEPAVLRGTIVKKEKQKEELVCQLENVRIQTDRSLPSFQCGKIRLILSSDLYPTGTTLIIKTKINKFKKARNEGAFDACSFYQSQGFWLQAREPQQIQKAIPEKGLRQWKYRLSEELYRLRTVLSENLRKLMDGENAGVLTGMLLGDKSRMDEETRSAYRNAGISHVLAISALHVSIFAMGLYRFLRRRGKSFLTAGILSGMLVECYGIMTGYSVSTGRAIAMFVILTGAHVLGRTYDMLSALGCWVLLALWENPFLTGYAGFVFSVTAVLGIGVTVRILEEYRKNREVSDRERRRKQEEENKGVRELIVRMFRHAWEALLGGAGISLTTLPLVAYYYYEIPTYAVFLNLLVIPLMKMVLVSGAAGALLGGFFVWAGKIAVFPADCVLTLYRRLCDGSLALPGSKVIVGIPGTTELLVYYGILAAGLFFLWRRNERNRFREGGKEGEKEQESRRRGKKRVAIAGAAAAGAMIAVLYAPAELRKEVDFLDVGQGLGVYFATEDDHSIFIDGGSTSEKNVGTYEILPFLKSRGIRKIDFWCISHGDQDHVNGAEEVFATGYPVDHLVLAEAMPHDEAYRKLVGCAKKNGSRILYMRSGQSLRFGKERLDCIFPGTSRERVTDDPNKNCLVLCFRGENGSVLFPGDISEEEEKMICEKKKIGRVDLLAAAHHGSRYSNSEEFLRRIRPGGCVISCGRKNRYGHPGKEALEHMKAVGALIYDTRKKGEVRIKLHKKR